MPGASDSQADGADSGFAHPASAPPRSIAGLISGAVPSRERSRAFRVLGGARLALGLILLLWFEAGAQQGAATGAAVALAYAVAVLLEFALSVRWVQAFALQVFAAVVTDLVGYTALISLAGPSAHELLLSYALPVLTAGVYGTLRFTLATAAAVSLALLAQAAGVLMTPGEPGDARVLGAGFVGAAYFAVGLLSWQLSQRLVRQEQRARQSETRAARQRAINRHVMIEHPDGVLVLDASLGIEAANPAAARMLGLPQERGDALATAVRSHLLGQHPGQALVFDGASGRRLQARVQSLRRLPGGPGHLVFLQDRRELDQQMLQAKLAALGRLVAAVAHEIRNPLSAIAHANQLAAEPGLGEAQRQRMSALIAQNAERLDRIVEDVLELGRSAARQPVSLQPLPLLRELVAEIVADDTRRVALVADDAAAVLDFDPLHLRRVLVNLLTNARRHASDAPGAIRVRLRGHARVREIGIANDGPVVPAELREQLFEPFFTTDSRGTGLGLYISQELCSRYGARIEYRLRPGTRPQGEFVICLPPR